jgi:hypothetical protein
MQNNSPFGDDHVIDILKTTIGLLNNIRDNNRDEILTHLNTLFNYIPDIVTYSAVLFDDFDENLRELNLQLYPINPDQLLYRELNRTTDYKPIINKYSKQYKPTEKYKNNYFLSMVLFYYIYKIKTQKSGLKSLLTPLLKLFKLKLDKSTLRESINDKVIELYNSIDNNDKNYTYTFEIQETLERNTDKILDNINIKHHLFSDLFMLRSEIPHDFSGSDKIQNLELYQEIINMCIIEYVEHIYLRKTNFRQIKSIIVDMIYKEKPKTKTQTKIHLNNLERVPRPISEEICGYSILQIIQLRNIPLIKDTKGNLNFEMDENLDDKSSALFPTIFKNKQIINVSDSFNTANNYFSGFANFRSITFLEYPFLKFDAGTPPTFFQTREPMAYNKTLNNVLIIPEQLPPIITVESLYWDYKLSIMPKKINNNFYYYFNFIPTASSTQGTNPSIQGIIDELNIYLKCYLFLDVKTSDVKKLVNSILNFLFKFYNKSNNAKEKTAVLKQANEYFNGAEYNQIEITENRFLIGGKDTQNTPKNFLENHIRNFDKNVISKLICKILLNLISIKSLGDLVTYHYVLVRQMMKEQFNSEQKVIQRVQNNLYNYFLDENQINFPLGSLSSADYSLIQSPLINIIFTGNNIAVNTALYDRCEMVASVHIDSNDLVLPLGKSETNIFRLMGCVINPDNNNMNNFFGNIVKNINVNNIFSMNIKDNVFIANRLKSSIIKLLEELNNSDLGIQINIDVTNLKSLTLYNFYDEILPIIGKIIDDLLNRDESVKIFKYINDSITIKNTLEAYIYTYNNLILLLGNENNDLLSEYGLINTIYEITNRSAQINNFLHNIENIGQTTNMKLDNPNEYFLSEYIIRCLTNSEFLNYMLQLTQNTNITNNMIHNEINLINLQKQPDECNRLTQSNNFLQNKLTNVTKEQEKYKKNLDELIKTNNQYKKIHDNLMEENNQLLKNLNIVINEKEKCQEELNKLKQYCNRIHTDIKTVLGKREQPEFSGGNNTKRLNRKLYKLKYKTKRTRKHKNKI